MTFGIAFKDLTNSHSYLQFIIVCVCVCMLSHVLFFCNPMEPTRFLYSWGSPGKNTGVGSLSLLQWIFLTQGSNQGLLHCRPILYQLSFEGSPKPKGRAHLGQLWPNQVSKTSTRSIENRQIEVECFYNYFFFHFLTASLNVCL